MSESKSRLEAENLTLRAELRRVYLLVYAAAKGNKDAQAKLTQIAEATAFAEKMKDQEANA